MTAVGKIFKPALRCDATRRALETALAPLRSVGIQVRVEAGPHERFGIFARLTVLEADPNTVASVRARIEEILGRFTVHREVVIAS